MTPAGANEIFFQQREADIALRLRDLMVKYDALNIASETLLSAELQHVQDVVDEFALDLLLRVQELDDVTDSEDTTETGDSIEQHRHQLADFNTQLNRLRKRRSQAKQNLRHAGVQSNNALEGSTGKGTSSRPPFAGRSQIGIAKQPAAAPPAKANRVAQLRSTRELLEMEVQRMAAANELLSKDSLSLSRTHAEHLGYGGDMETARDRVGTYKHREAMDRLQLRSAFVLFTVVAAYIAARRVLWTFFGVRLPGL